jgi:hypothetical protein
VGERDLNVVQRWFQAVITHPRGVEEGVESAEANGLIPLTRGELEKVVLRSSKLGAADRMRVYANAYYARLIDCLRESFPVLAQALGDEMFDSFAFEYLGAYPSRSYTLERLADHFADFLAETRPDLDEEGDPPAETAWPDFLIDLARLEHAIGEVFDGPGVERLEDGAVLRKEDLAEIDAATWGGVRLEPVVCLRLMAFRYPVNAYYSEARKREREGVENGELPMPDPADEYVALWRRDFIVRRMLLSLPQYLLLQTLTGGGTVNEAISAAGAVYEGDDDALAEDLMRWFYRWAAGGVFMGLK